jgi:hypothetical protein
MPEMRLPTTVSRHYIPPYFNSGLVAVDREAGLGPAWLECCRPIMGDPSIPEVGRWADQIALAMAVQKLGLPYDCLDERYNFPLRLKPLVEDNLPYFCHYGNFESAAREPAVVETVGSLVSERPGLGDVLQARGESGSFLAGHRSRSTSVAARRNRSRPELVVTGISGSGLDLLTDLLNGYSNCVVLSEPAEVLRPRANQPAPWMIAPFYRRARADVLEGRSPSDGSARPGDEESPAGVGPEAMTVESEDFVLGTAHAHPYLLRLHAIRRAMPEARVVACVRDPFETIGSWKQFGEGLPGSEALLPRAGTSADAAEIDAFSWLTIAQRDTLSVIAGAADPAQRRATWWQFLADLILDQAGAVTVVDYRRLVEDTEAVLSEVLSGYPAGAPSAPIVPAPTSTGMELDERDEQAIRAICSQTAVDLGVWS